MICDINRCNCAYIENKDESYFEVIKYIIND